MGPEKDSITHMAALAEHLERVRRHVAFLLRGRRDAVDDCVQQTLLEACRSIDKHGPPEYPKSWLSRIAERVVYRNNTRAGRRAVAEASLEQHNPATTGSVLDSVVRTEEASRVRTALDGLPTSDRMAIEQHYCDGMPCQDIGREVGTSADGVKSRLYRSRIELRRHLAADRQERGK